MNIANILAAGFPHEFIIWAVFIIIIGLAKLAHFLYNAIKQFSESQGSGSFDRQRSEAPQERSRQQARPSRPPKQKRRRQGAPPPVPAGYEEPPPVPQNLAMSNEAAAAVVQMHRTDDRFKARQDRAYDTEASDVLRSADSAYELGDGARKRRAKRKARVPFNRRRDVKNALIMREVIERPRCFDI